ncbi:MAG: hypothetical protein JNL74_00925, partial [Fibrobacteres bacterium]|nr:hypothetical protein [Fibrobacterota bacterium]
FALKGPVTSNGFDHYVYWNSADSSFYHVNTRGASVDTHLVKRYQARFLSRDTVVAQIGSVGYIRDTSYKWTTFGNQAWYFFRNDTQIIVDTLEYYTGAPGGNIVLRDTLIAIHVGSLGQNPSSGTTPNFRGLDGLWDYDYLIVNGKRIEIRGRQDEKSYYDTRLRLWVNARDCPTGTNITINGTYRTLPELKTFSSDISTKYSLLADPYQKNKLYLFYISDSGRVMSQVTWDNGLTWEEMFEATKNPVLTDSSDHTRNNLSVSINGSGVISISWSGVGTTSTTLNVPGVGVDTVVMYVKPTGLASDDQRHTSVIDVATFKTVMTPSTAFTSIDRCMRQIIMLEKGVTHSQSRILPTTDTTSGNTRAILSRFYNIRLLPGNHMSDWGDKAVVDGYGNGERNALNIVFSPGKDRSIKIESHYSNPESLAVMNLAISGATPFTTTVPQSRGGAYMNNIYAINNYHTCSHLSIERIKFTSVLHTKETSSNSCVFSLGNLTNVRGLTLTNNLFYSMDSTDYATVGRRYLDRIFNLGNGSTTPFDNVVFAGNVFHRVNRFNGYSLNMSKMDYSGGMMFLNNTFYKWRDRSYWTGHGMVSKMTYINNLVDSSTTPYTGYGISRTGFLLNDSAGNIRDLNNSIQWLDTIPARMSMHKIALSSLGATGGVDVITLDSIWKSDFYGVKTSGSRHIGACVPAPSNPLRLECSLDTLHTPGFRTIKVKILNKSALAANIDTIRIFRDTSGYVRNPYSKEDAAYTRSTSPDSYFSADVPKTYYYFTVAVGIKQSNGNVNWSNIDPTINGAMPILQGLYPPQLGFSISDTINGTTIGTDSLRIKVYSPFSRGQARESKLKKIWVYFGTDSSIIVNAFSNRDTLSSYASYPYVASIHPFLGPIYADTSSDMIFTGLKENTRYHFAAVCMDSSTNLCRPDTVIKYMKSFVTRQAPPNVLRLTADTLWGEPTKLRVTISGFNALPTYNPAIDSTKIKLYVRYTGFVLSAGTTMNSSTFRDTLIDIRTSLVDGKWTGIIDHLPSDSTIYLSVSVSSINGYYSRIVQDTNTVYCRTPLTPDRVAVNMSAVTIDAARPTDTQLLNGLYITYKLGNLDAIPQRDRSTMRIKVMWDTSDAHVLDPNLQIPGQEILYPADLLSNETSYRVVSSGVLPGRKYHVAA